MIRRVRPITTHGRPIGLLFSALFLSFAIAVVPLEVLSPQTVHAVIQTQLPQPARPILIITNNAYGASPFAGYLAEILRAEGIVEFQQVNLTSLLGDSNRLNFLKAFNVVLLAKTSLDGAGEQLFRDYVIQRRETYLHAPGP